MKAARTGTAGVVAVDAAALLGSEVPASTADDSAVRAAISPEELAELMTTFNGVAEQLQSTHCTLTAEVARLQEELREKNEQLQRSRELAALGQMAAGIAHEIRNPLGSIRLYASMLFHDLVDRPENQRMAGKIERATVDMDAIVRDVLAFARRNEPVLVEMDAEVLLRQAVDSCVSLLHGKAIEVEWKVALEEETARLALVDAGLMNQALGNVVRNGLEAIGESGRLELGIKGGCAGEVVLTITDSGQGLNAGNAEKIFNPFFTTKASGTGLGLAITHRIIDAHGGRISMANVGEGGVCVEIGLRLAGDPMMKDES